MRGTGTGADSEGAGELSVTSRTPVLFCGVGCGGDIVGVVVWVAVVVGVGGFHSSSLVVTRFHLVVPGIYQATLHLTGLSLLLFCTLNHESNSTHPFPALRILASDLRQQSQTAPELER